MENVGYRRALDLAQKQLAELDPQKVAENTGTVCTGDGFVIPWLGRMIPLEEGSIEQRIIWYHYLTTQGPKKPRNKYMAYKQVPGAAIYDSNFAKRSINPMVKCFSDKLDVFMQFGQSMGGKQVDLGHAAFTVQALPYIPLTYILWQGDDEVQPSGNILFDETAMEWLCAEDLVVIASLPVYEMIGMLSH